MDRRTLLKGAFGGSFLWLFKGSGAASVRKKKKMTSSPQVITVPAGAGVGLGAPIQTPSVDSGSPTLVNLSPNLTLVLCNDSNFSNTYNLSQGQSLPLPGAGSVFIQNPNNVNLNVLVLDGIVPVTFSTPPNQGGLSIAGGPVTTTGPPTQILPAPIIGFAYRLQSVVFTYQNEASATLAANIMAIYIETTGSSYFAGVSIPALPLSGIFVDTQPLYGQLCNGNLYVTLNQNAASSIGQAIITYDIVPI